MTQFRGKVGKPSGCTHINHIKPGVRCHLPAVCRSQLVGHPVASARSARPIIWNARGINTVCEFDH